MGKWARWPLKPLPTFKVCKSVDHEEFPGEMQRGQGVLLGTNESNINTFSTLSPVHKNAKGIPACPKWPQFLPQRQPSLHPQHKDQATDNCTRNTEIIAGKSQKRYFLQGHWHLVHKNNSLHIKFCAHSNTGTTVYGSVFPTRL